MILKVGESTSSCAFQSSQVVPNELEKIIGGPPGFPSISYRSRQPARSTAAMLCVPATSEHVGDEAFGRTQIRLRRECLLDIGLAERVSHGGIRAQHLGKRPMFV